MSEYEELLNRTIHDLGALYQEAQIDLALETEEVAKAVAKLTGGLGRISLVRTEESPQGTKYGLFLRRKDSIDEIVFFLISPKGYPIKAAATEGILDSGSCEAQLRDKNALKDYYRKAASNRDSRLATRLAFTMRQQSNAASENPSQ
jgi:hypothetical protein